METQGGDTRYGKGLVIQFIDEVDDGSLGSNHICYLQPLPCPRPMVSHRSTSAHKLALPSLPGILHSYIGGGGGDTSPSSLPPLCLNDCSIIAILPKVGTRILEIE